MKKEALRVSTTIPAAPTTVYFAWLSGEQHAAMTGGAAKIEPEVGSKFTAWDGYITGKLVTLDLGRRIIMAWRTTDFPRDAHDSRVEVHFEGLGAGTRLTIIHTEIPEGQGEKYRSGWVEHYFNPMRSYFSKYLPDPRNPPVRRPPPPPIEDEEEEEAPRPKKGKLEAKAKTSVKAPSPSPSKAAKPTPSAKAAPAKAKPAPKVKPAPAKAKPAPKKAPAKAKPAPKKAPAKKPAPKAKAPPKKAAPKKAPAKKPAKKKGR